MTKATTAAPRAGDRVRVPGHRVGDAPRSGAITEVLGVAPNQHFQVRWEDGHVSVLYPGSDVEIVRRRAPAAGRRPRTPRPA